MKEENKPTNETNAKAKNKKKILLTYLILAACLLVIAAITVTLIFTIGRPADNFIDDGTVGNEINSGNNNVNQNEPDGNDKNNDDEKNNDNKEDNKPASSDNNTLYLPVSSAVVTTRYEFAHDVTLNRYCVHQGMDFEAKAGDSVCAVLDGTVKEVVTDSLIGENYVVISHGNGMTSTYKYIEAKSGLKAGSSVKRGDVIGSVAAASGYEMNQGEHLHFELSVNGQSADPDTYLDLVEK